MGIEAGLADRLRLLTGGPRIDDRHRSLRSTLDWSYALLDEPDQAMLRRVSVFAGPFTATAAAAVLAGWPPVPAGAIPTILAGLADQSLLIAIAEPSGTRYRALETIRQYGVDRLEDAGESVEALSRHLSWCLDESAALEVASGEIAGAWRAAFDQVADELRAALAWAAGDARSPPGGVPVGDHLADLSFTRGMPGESQRRYEQAAELAADDRAAAAALRERRRCRGVPTFRQRGDAAAPGAADAALRAGDRAGAAGDLARNAELINRGPGLMATGRAAGEVEALIAEGWALAERRPGRGGAAAHRRGIQRRRGRSGHCRARRARSHAGPPHRRSADRERRARPAHGGTAGSRRGPRRGGQRVAAHRAADLDAGDGRGPRWSSSTGSSWRPTALSPPATCRQHGNWPNALRDLPFHREEGHLATARLLVVSALAGDWAEALGLAERYREGWERAGRPRAGNLSRAAYAAATVHGLRGDDDARAAWLDIVDALATPGRPLSQIHFGEFFDALLLLHRGLPATGDAAAGHATGAVPGLAQRHVAAVVRRAVGRGGGAQRA